MDISELTIKLLLLFFPGIVCYLIVDALIVHRERKLHEIFLLSFVYGVLAYVIYADTAPSPVESYVDGGGSGAWSFVRSGAFYFLNPRRPPAPQGSGGKSAKSHKKSDALDDSHSG